MLSTVCYEQSRISRTPYPPSGGWARCNRSPKFSPITTYIPKESFDPPNWNMKHYKSVTLGGPFERKVLVRYSNCGPFWKQAYNYWWGPFESKVAYVYNTVAVGPFTTAVWGSFAVGGHTATAVVGFFKSKVACLYITVAVGPLWKQGTLHLTVAIGGPIESVVSLLTNYLHLLLCASLKASDLHITVAIVVLLKAEYLYNAVSDGRPYKPE